MLLVLFVLFLPNTVLAEQSLADTSKKLTDVQKAIQRQQSKIKSTNKARQVISDEIKQNDLAIAQIAKKLTETLQRKKNTQQKISSLIKKLASLERKKTQQEAILAEQLRSIYSNGEHDYLKLLLNQQQSNKIQRTITYYQYLTDANLKEIDRFKAIIANIEQVKLEQEQQKQQLIALEAEQIQQQQSLNKSKKTRQKNLTALNKTLQTDQEKLAQLKAQQDNLVKALEQLAKAAKASADLNGLASLTHRLSWPTKGRIVKRFGARKQGYLKWKGVLISAPVSRQVTAIQNGKVLFSDWLNGYGLVTVIDHGKGYMSLYGHNQTLLKDVGDRVETGEPIALVGQSGGQNQPGLYFEIRYKGKAMNPAKWCR